MKYFNDDKNNKHEKKSKDSKACPSCLCSSSSPEQTYSNQPKIYDASGSKCPCATKKVSWELINCIKNNGATDCDLSCLDFTPYCTDNVCNLGYDISGATLSGANLSGYTFNLHKKDTNFSNVVIQQSDQCPNNLTNFSNASMKNIDFSSLSIQNAKFTNTNLSGANFASTKLTSTKFCGASMSKTDFTNAVVNGCDFSKADLGKTDFTNAAFYNTCFKNADLSSATMNGSAYINCDFSGAKCPDGACPTSCLSTLQTYSKKPSSDSATVFLSWALKKITSLLSAPLRIVLFLIKKLIQMIRR